MLSPSITALTWATTILGFGQAAAVSAASAASTGTPALQPSLHSAAARGNLVFNAVFDGLRKWGATVHHNSMSLFLATIPQGAVFYHGSDRNATPTTMEWLAYELEHAQLFAWPSGIGPQLPRVDHDDRQRVLSSDGNDDDDDDDDDDEPLYGWLHVYRATRDLHLLYIDGMSGNKDGGGISDAQDFILRADMTASSTTTSATTTTSTVQPSGTPDLTPDRERAEDICKLCVEWGLDGAIRTESPGTEMIYCDFSSGLEKVQSLARPGSSEAGPGSLGRGSTGGGGGPRGPDGRPGHPEYGLHVTGDPVDDVEEDPWGPSPTTGPDSPEDAFRDVSGSRTLLDYASMVSAFFFPVNLSNPDAQANDSHAPRLLHTTAAERRAMKAYLKQVIDDRRHAPPAAISWRDIADMIVRRYARALAELVAAETNTVAAFQQGVLDLLSVVLDASEPDTRKREQDARQRCVDFYLPAMQDRTTETDALLRASFSAVTSKICGTLFDAAQMVQDGKEDGLAPAKKSVHDLIRYLDWSIFDRKLVL